MDASATRERARTKMTEEPGSAPPGSEVLTSSGVYGGFWELPVALVLAVLWTTGAALLVLCAFTLYLVVTALA
jgi:hypothetical protein